MAIWNIALTSGQTQTLYNNGQPGDISSLSPMLWYKMGDGDFFPIITDHGSLSFNGWHYDKPRIRYRIFQIDTPMGYGVAENMVSGVNNFSGGTANGNGGFMFNMSQGDIQHDVPKYSNKSFLFDGVSDYITMGDVLDFNFDDTFSISVWFKATVISAQDLFVAKQN